MMSETAYESEGLNSSWSGGGEAEIVFYPRWIPEATQSRLLAREMRNRLVRAWRKMLESRPRESLQLIASIASRLDEVDYEAAERYRMQVHLIRAVGKALSDDPKGVLHELSGVEIDRCRGHLIRTLLRFAYWRLARWAELYRLPVANSAHTPCHATAQILDLTVMAAAAFERLQLITASRFATDAISTAEAGGLGDSIAAVSAAAVLACVRYELGYLDHAEQLVLGRVPIICAQGAPDVIIRVYILLSRIARHRGQHEHAAVILSEGQSLGERRFCARIVLTMMAEKVRTLLARDDVFRARQEVSAMRHYAQVHPANSHLRDEIALVCAQAHLQLFAAEGDMVRAIAMTRDLLRTAVSSRRRDTAFRLSLELAGALNANGDEELADRLMVRALERGERVGLLQCWIDAGRACGSLLERIAQRLPHAASPQLAAVNAYLRTILAHRTTSRFTHQRALRPSIRADECLSAREREVLVLIAKGQSNKLAAQTLNIAPETIKSHLKRAFVKLGAKTRAEAVSRAADLGQLIGVVIPTTSKRESRYF